MGSMVPSEEYVDVTGFSESHRFAYYLAKIEACEKNSDMGVDNEYNVDVNVYIIDG